MKYDSYQHVGIKTFFINLIKNGLPTIFIFIIWVVLLVIKTQGVGNVFSLNTPDIIQISDFILNWAIFGSFVFVALLFALALLITSIDYFTFYFMIDNSGLCIKKGLVDKQEISIPYKQIQDIDIDRPFIYQMFGVCRLNILTAGQDSDHDNDPTEANFPIIDKDLAYNLRETLLGHSSTQTSNTAQV